MSLLFASGGQSIRALALASVLPVNIQGWFPLGLTGLISLLLQELSRVFSTTVQKHLFFGIQFSYDPTLTPIHDYWEKLSFDYLDLCWQSDVFALNMLSRFVIAFLPRSKCLLISWLQSLFTVFWSPNLSLFPLFPLLFKMKWWDQMPWSLLFACRVLTQLFHSPFTFITRFFSSSSLSAIRVVSSEYLRLLVFCLAILTLSCKESSPFQGKSNYHRF